jgi:cytochrome P450
VGRIVWLRDAELIEQVARHPATDFAEIARFLEPMIGAKALPRLQGEEHRQVRRHLVAGVRGAALAGHEAAITDSARRMVDTCPTGVPVRLLPLLEQAVLRANIRTALTVSDDAAMEIWVDHFLRLRRTGNSIPSALHGAGVLPWYPPVHRRLRDCMALIRGEVRRRRGAGTSDDLLGRLLAAQGGHLTEESICAQILAYLAGGQSSAFAAAWALERAIRHPQAWEAVNADQSTGQSDDTDAVIRESLRLRPPIPIMPWFLRSPCVLAGHRIPARTWVMTSLWNLHRSPDLYPEPEAFRPERFLGARPPRQGWLPFGAGPHACVAAQLSILQVKVLMHTLARSGGLRPDRPQDEGISSRAGLEITPQRGCRVILQPHSIAVGQGRTAVAGSRATRARRSPRPGPRSAP